MSFWGLAGSEVVGGGWMVVDGELRKEVDEEAERWRCVRD